MFVARMVLFVCRCCGCCVVLVCVAFGVNCCDVFSYGCVWLLCCGVCLFKFDVVCVCCVVFVLF